MSCPAIRRLPFRFFAERTNEWWPLDKHSLTAGNTGKAAKSVTIEPGVGGRIIEKTPEGEELHWGSVKVYEPGEILCFSWHVTEPVEKATEVEVRFEAVSPKETRVTLEHRNWDVLGEAGEESRGHYNNGWVHVFEDCFGGACREQRARA